MRLCGSRNDGWVSVRHERGVSLLEFSIVLPLIIVMIAGIVDLGLALRKAQVISDAARHGARLGSSRNLDCTVPASATSTARNGAVGYLSNAGLDQSNWTVAPTLWPPPGTLPRDEGGFSYRSIQVSIERNADESLCVLCALPGLNKLGAGFQSTFLLEAPC